MVTVGVDSRCRADRQPRLAIDGVRGGRRTPDVDDDPPSRAAALRAVASGVGEVSRSVRDVGHAWPLRRWANVLPRGALRDARSGRDEPTVLATGAPCRS